MKSNKIIYWISTALVALMMLYSASAYLTQPAMKAAFQHLGYPDYFRIELAIGKIIGAILLLAPVAARVKEWTYAGFAITFISAAIAHTASGDPVANRIMPVVFLILLVVSYGAYHKQQKATIFI
ncbi:DoxX family protein [Mucilaginibacter agri]|uniref:DoxX family protein n=1 Tax=Mucilaginibacter agri TaxID=2695265 RepID=A0A966DTB4_9SPHI|nr:DoxX family protein [Mucilaginibacter agri]NCD71078.1 DoxX family protein [Mucilaginibacter agri]